MKKLIALGVIAFGLTLSAQEPAKVTSQDAMSYNRCSISVIPLLGNTEYDSYVTSWAQGQDFDGKFDYNDISEIRISGTTASDTIGSILVSKRVPKQILDFWLQYDGKQFNNNLLEKRSRYNATDADVLKDKGSKVSTLYANGKPLMKNSFILVAGPTEVKKTETKKGIVYTASVNGYAYLVDLNDEVLTTVWENWLDDEAPAQAKVVYDNLNISLNEAASVKNVTGTDADPVKAINEALYKMFEKLEKKIDKWQVVTSVYQLHPIGAKIGKKEGLKNSDRYAAYRVVEDADGNLVYKRIGYTRATTIADNATDATGESPCSDFYQISGRRNVKEGMFLKQKKDAKISVSISGNIMAYNPINVDVDYLIKTSHKMGLMQYAGISIGGDFGKDEYTGEHAFWIPVSLHYGIGIHPLRWLEVLPNIGVGADYYGMPSLEDSNLDDDSSFMKQVAYFAHGGVKVGFQVWYPVQVFVRADYSYKFAEGEFYAPCDSHKRFNRLSLGAGVKINF